MGEDEPGLRSCSEHHSHLNFGPEGAGDGRFYRTARGEGILDVELGNSKDMTKNGLLRSLNGRLTDAHKVLCSAAQIACKGRHDIYFGHDGGYMIPIHSKIGQGMTIHFEKLVNWHGQNELIPVYLENNIFHYPPESRSEIDRDQQCERC